MTYTEHFNSVFAYYLAIGMPSMEFWEGDPWLVRSYRKAHRQRNEQRNQEMWLQGLYNFKAFESVINMFAWGLGGGKGAQPKGYMEQPLDISPKPKPKQTKEGFLKDWKARKAAWQARQ